MSDELFKQEGYDLMAAAFEVYNKMGSGFLEDVYQECLALELSARKIPWIAKPKLSIVYKAQPLNKWYEPDLVTFSEIIVELKAARTLAPEHEAQLINYLKATRKRVGYLINFGAHPRLEWRRFVIDPMGNE